MVVNVSRKVKIKKIRRNLSLKWNFSSTIIDNVIKSQNIYENEVSAKKRKINGHFGTTPEIALYMANYAFTDKLISQKEISILDPGSGVGILSLAICQVILQFEIPRIINICCYEIDKKLIQYLQNNLESAKKFLLKYGHTINYKIYNSDFILANSNIFTDPIFADKRNEYDIVIMNPPYFKISKKSEYSKKMSDIIYGQPNIYALFMAMGVKFLNPNGKLIAITPRSFCNGLYFKAFRKFYLSEVDFTHFHHFLTRNQLFKKDTVLQENIISVARKKNSHKLITISNSKKNNFQDRIEIKANKKIIIDNSYDDSIIRLPENKFDLNLIKFIDSFDKRFSDYDYNISTGPVVPFRAKAFLLNKYIENRSVPLIAPHNIKFFKTVWPLEKKNKPLSFLLTKESDKLLVPVNNYVLIKRFTTKEEKRRLVASVLFKEKFLPFKRIALENHTNYIYKNYNHFTIQELYGLCAVLNSSLYDRYFRLINGLTQVNAREIKHIPFPNTSIIKKIGSMILENHVSEITIGILDKIIQKNIILPNNIIQYLKFKYT